MPERTLRQWIAAEGWMVTLDPELAIQARITHLVGLGEDKTDKQWDELDRLPGVLEKLGRAKAASLKAQARTAGMAEASAGDSPGDGRKKKKGKAKKNEVGEIDLEAANWPRLFTYQQEVINDHSRFLLWKKSRQIGATKVVVAIKAIRRIIETGHNQIFISASKRQAHVIQQAICDRWQEAFGWELDGSKDELSLHRDGKPWGKFIFLSTNTATAQSHDGDLYIDEAAWIPRFEKLSATASGMATLKKYRKMYFSTVSIDTHKFEKLWEGDVDKNGKRKADNITRILTTVHDAVAGGNDLIDIDMIRQENTEGEFRQLYECIPLSDGASLFKMALMEKCQSDPARWPTRFDFFRLGYDPSRNRDYACLVLLGVIRGKDGKERHYHLSTWKWHNKAHAWQAKRIVDICREAGWDKVDKVGIDTTGAGIAVYDEAKAELGSKSHKINYSPDTKNDLILGAKRVFDEGRYHYETGDQFITNSFLAIKQTGTDAGRMTFKAGRTEDTGHAEGAWAVSHALKFDKTAKRRRSRAA
ncbi:MAG: terminase family protein [Deltaproteobacteria bacterium]|nr:terminase family protein [Deltaproteobacteria bacterium]